MVKSMKVLMAALVCLTFAIPLVAQEETMPAMPPYTSMHIENVKPGMINEYIEGTKKWIEELKSKNLGLIFFCFRDMAGNFHYGVPYSKWAEIDALQEKMAKAVAMLRESDWGRKRQAAINWSRYEAWYHSAHLSYMPKEPSDNPQELLYTGWANVRVSHTNEGKFNELMARIKTVYEKHSLGRGYSVYRNLLGANGPLYVIVWAAKDPADMYHWEKNEEGKIWPEAKPIFDELMKVIEEKQEGNGWVMPELSLMPGM